MSEFPAYRNREPVTEKQISSLINIVGGASAMVSSLQDVDCSLGRATIAEGRNHCLWTKDGRRVTVFANSSAVIVSCSEDVDPIRPRGPVGVAL